MVAKTKRNKMNKGRVGEDRWNPTTKERQDYARKENKGSPKRKKK